METFGILRFYYYLLFLFYYVLFYFYDYVNHCPLVIGHWQERFVQALISQRYHSSSERPISNWSLEQ